MSIPKKNSANIATARRQYMIFGKNFVSFVLLETTIESMGTFLLLVGVFSVLAVADSADDWNYLTSGPWGGREGLMGTYFNGYIWMSGGRYSPPSFKHINESIFYNDVWKLDPSCIKHTGSCKWELVSKDNEWEGRGYHIMFNHTVGKKDYMYIIGGQNLTTFYNDVWRSEDGKKWEQVTK